MKPCIFQRIADLDNLVTKNTSGQSPKRCVVLLHGFGANFEDLASLGEVLDPLGTFDWYFPNAPHEIPIAPGYVGRAWFPIDLQRLQLALMQGVPEPLANEVPKGFSEASSSLDRMIKVLATEYSSITVGGFSQGSMVATDFALSSSTEIDALLLLSSNMVARPRFQENLKNRLQKGKTRFKIFQSHGDRDPTLPRLGADSLNQFWLNEGFNPEYTVFNGGHEIPYAVLEKLKTFLKAL
ncbi:MAG: esterase [Proteobacteria bacterium]|nr:MAG: esterase [Pseudomonadota bacterium]